MRPRGSCRLAKIIDFLSAYEPNFRTKERLRSHDSTAITSYLQSSAFSAYVLALVSPEIN